MTDNEMQISSYFICCANQSTKIPEHFKVTHSIYVYVKQLEYQIHKLKTEEQHLKREPLSDDEI